ncbi:MAG: C4-dicarboxylate ABC transporter [Comamonadaceae bacterium CG_4_10_14_3_um_filter_60_42]|nr:MAG: C4-dicarboxylate ABC transporter [Comamonadaceae bacterium CG_4_10_14_3_um_filter_60_42]
MHRFVRAYVRFVDVFNYRIGRVAMYLFFGLMGTLLYSSASKVFFEPALWTLEMAQFVMTAYFFLGGPYAMQMGSDVRMDLFYGDWSSHTRAWVDAFTALFLLFYLGVMLYGGIGSTSYAIEYGETNSSAWRPYMWPIKVVMCLAIILMILQASAEFFKDIARIQDKEI